MGTNAQTMSDVVPEHGEPVRLLDLIETIECALWEIETDTEGRAKRFIFLSNTAEKLMGHPHSFLLDPPNWYKIVHPDDVEAFMRLAEAPFPPDGRKVYRHRIIAAEGRVIPIEATVTLVRNAEGVPVALHGVTLDISEQYRSMERWKTLAHTAEALGELHDVQTTLRTITQLLVPATADLCSIYLKNESGDAPIPAITASTPELEAMLRESAERFPPRPETRAVILSALESKQSFVVEVTDEFRRKNSSSDEHYEFQKRMDIRSAIITPLFVEEELLGVILISVVGTRPGFSEEDRLFVEEVARQASVAIHNARLLDSSRELTRQARMEVEQRTHLQSRLELLEEISQRVSGSLHVQDLLSTISTIIAPRFADWFTVDLVTPSGALDRIFLYHSNPELRLLSESYRARYRHEVSPALEEIMRTGDPILIPFPTERARNVFGLRAQRWEFVQELGAHSLIMVPLRSRRRTLGILGLDYGHSGRQYSAEDLEFAVEIASRIAAGIDNALLFEEAAQEITRRAELQKHLEEAKDEAEIANRAKDQFIATLSHELRTPLTPVLATIDLLAEDNEFPEGLQPYLTVLRRNIQIEARLIDDLLDMTRVAKGKLRFVETDVDLHVVIAEVIEMCEHEFDRGSLRLITRLRAANPFVRGDRDRLSQVLWNLLHNATKFTPEGGLITIRTNDDGPERIVIEVEDTGCGIEQAELTKIFEPFEQRADLRSGAYGGLGLGLAISRSIVEMHGGTIEAKSPGAGRGATFSLSLKVTQLSEHSKSRPSGTVPSNARTGRILMVDDHLDTNAALKILLERRGYHVTTAASVARGLELARLHPFNVLVSDIGLPDGDGIDLLRAIRSDGRTSHTMRAIAVSGYGTQADIERSIAAGFKYHLKKPFAFPDLERAIADVMDEAS